MTRRTRAAVLFGLVALALAFRLFLALHWPNDEPDDSRVYTLLARNLLSWGAYSVSLAPPMVPTYVRVPGYPLFIAGVYRLFGVGNDTAVRVLQVAVETAACWVVGCLAFALAPRRWPEPIRWRVRAAALGLAAVCPFTAIYVTTVLTEALAVALGATLAWLAARALEADTPAPADGPHATPAPMTPSSGRWWWLAAGLAGGALTIVRPEGGLVTAGAGVALVAGFVLPQRSGGAAWLPRLRRVIASGAMLSLGFLAFEGPWVARNAAVFGVFQPTAPSNVAMPEDFFTFGYNHWLRTWVNEPRWVQPFEFDQDRVRFSVDRLPPWAFDSPEERRLVTELFALYNDGAPGAVRPRDPETPAGFTPEIDRRFETLAGERAHRHPVRHYLLLPMERLFWLWVGPHAQYYPFDGDLFPLASLDREMNQHIWLPLFTVLTLLWTLAGAAGVVRLSADRTARMGLLLVALIVVPRLVLLASIENPEPRYMVELFPFLSALGGIALGGPRSAAAAGARGTQEA